MNNHHSATKQITLTTGMFDILKEQIRKKRVNPKNECQILFELKNAKQVQRKDLPSNIVDVYKKVIVREINSGDSFTYLFVPPNLARQKHGTISILSEIGLALLGHTVDSIIEWDTKEGEKAYRIESVSDL